MKLYWILQGISSIQSYKYSRSQYEPGEKGFQGKGRKPFENRAMKSKTRKKKKEKENLYSEWNIGWLQDIDFIVRPKATSLWKFNQRAGNQWPCFNTSQLNKHSETDLATSREGKSNQNWSVYQKFKKNIITAKYNFLSF